MPFLIRPSRRFPVCCSVTYQCGLFEGHGTVWNLSCIGWRLSGDLPMRPEETISLTVTLEDDRATDVRSESVPEWLGAENHCEESFARCSQQRQPSGRRIG